MKKYSQATGSEWLRVVRYFSIHEKDANATMPISIYVILGICAIIIVTYGARYVS